MNTVINKRNSSFGFELEQQVSNAFERVGWSVKTECMYPNGRCSMRVVDIELHHQDLTVFVETYYMVHPNKQLFEKKIEQLSALGLEDDFYILTNGVVYDIIHKQKVYSELPYPPSPDVYRSITNTTETQALPSQLDTLLGILMQAKQSGATTLDQVNGLSSFLQSNGYILLEKYNKLKTELNDIKNKNAELGFTLNKMQTQLDDYSNQLSENRNTMCSINNTCSKVFNKFWDKLDRKSQIYVCTGFDLLQRFQSEKSENDYAPIVIEFSRSFENEMRTKMFAAFVDYCQELGIEHSVFCHNDDKALLKYQDNIRQNSTCELSLGEMLIILPEVTWYDGFEDSNIKYQMKRYLKDAWDIGALEDSDFIDKAKTFNRQYRRPAAHADTVMTQKDANDCKAKYGKITNRFIAAYTNNG